MKGKKLVVGVISAVVVIVMFFALQRLVIPKYAGDTPLEGSFTAEYYDENTEHDVIMVGDCEVYENFDPMVLWSEYGITSYIRGNAQQLVWQSYYMLEDTLKREKPKVVIYNVQSLVHGEPQREEYNRACLDGMKWSKTKVDAINASMCKGENLVDYAVPILRFHSRITELTQEDVKYYFEPRKITHNGYYMRIDTLPASQSDMADPSWLLGTEEEKNAAQQGENEIDDPWAEIDALSDEDADDSEQWEDSAEDTDEGQWEDSAEDTDNGEQWEEDSAEEDNAGEIDDPWAEIEGADETDEEEGSAIVEPGAVSARSSEDKGKQFSSYAMGYLDRMRKLCQEEGIQLILIKAPSLAPQWYDSQNQQVVDYAEKNALPYINFYELLEETGIDYETDTYDGGLHMNYSGATKLSHYLGKYLTDGENVHCEDHRGDANLSKVYEEKLQFQEKMKEAQQKELDKYGEIRNY